MSDRRYHRVSPKFWSDPKVLGWSDDARLLALYILTCEHRTTEGLFRCPKPYMQADLGWSAERFAEPFAQLLRDGFIEWDEQAAVILIVKALRWQAPDNPNQVKSAVKALEMLPPTHLAERFVALAKTHSERLAEALPEGFGEPLPEGLGERIPDPPAPAPAPAPPPAPAPNPLSTDVDDEDDDRFDEFWNAYPTRNGKKVGKQATRVEWNKLNADQRDRAIVGARHLAASDQLPKDPERFLRRDKGGGRCFDDWQTPARSPNGHTTTVSTFPPGVQEF